MKFKIGEINKLQVKRKSDIGYMLINDGHDEILLPFSQTEYGLHDGQEVEVFIQLDSKKRLVASMLEPNLVIGKPGFVTVKNVRHDLGIFLENNTLKDPLVSNDDLPFNYDFWPEVGDTVFAKLKTTSTNLIARLISPEEAKTMFPEAPKLNKFNKVNGIVIKNGREGTNVITYDGQCIFIYYKHRRRDYRIGEEVTVTINNVLLDGTYNGTLLETKVKLMKNDADIIIDYLEKNNYMMPFTAKSSVESIEETFKMSKASFKRALGGLYKQRLIEFDDNFTYLKK